MMIDQSIARVRAYRRSKGWSVLRFAKETGLRESTIRNLDRDDWSPTAGTLRRLETIIPSDFDIAPATTGGNPPSDRHGGADVMTATPTDGAQP